MKKIVFYALPSGKKPVEAFLDSLSAKEAQKMVWVLKLIEEFETVSTQYYKPLTNTDGIIEIRAHLGKNHFRLLGFEDQNTLVILTNGFRKKDQKVPQKEIRLAQQRKEEYLTHKEKNNE